MRDDWCLSPDLVKLAKSQLHLPGQFPFDNPKVWCLLAPSCTFRSLASPISLLRNYSRWDSHPGMFRNISSVQDIQSEELFNISEWHQFRPVLMWSKPVEFNTDRVGAMAHPSVVLLRFLGRNQPLFKLAVPVVNRPTPWIGVRFNQHLTTRLNWAGCPAGPSVDSYNALVFAVW